MPPRPRKDCRHCGQRPKEPGPGGVCLFCWLTVPTRFIDEPHDPASCSLEHDTGGVVLYFGHGLRYPCRAPGCNHTHEST
jgi:hypothetical protein